MSMSIWPHPLYVLVLSLFKVGRLRGELDLKSCQFLCSNWSILILIYCSSVLFYFFQVLSLNKKVFVHLIISILTGAYQNSLSLVTTLPLRPLLYSSL